jgi:O-antigen/teichoic acid export membrane protein
MFGVWLGNIFNQFKLNVKEQLSKPFKTEGFKKYASNTGWLFAEQILRSISGILVGVWVARYLGPELFGIYSYAVSFVVLFGAIAHLGLQVIVVRELVNKPDQQKNIMGTALYMQMIGAVVMILLISAILPFTSNDATTNIYILIIASGLIFQSFQVIDFYFQSKVQAKYVSYCRLVQLTISSILKIGLVLADAELIYFVAVIVIDNITLAIALIYAYWKQGGGSFYKSYDAGIVKILIKECWPLLVASLVHIVYMRIDQVMIKEMMDAASVGVYSAAVKFSEAWYFVPVLIGQSLFPAIINAKKNSERLYIHRLTLLLNVMMAVSVVVGIVLSFSSDLLVDLFYGPSYAGAGTVLSIQVWAGIFVSSGVVANKWYIIEGHQKYNIYPILAGAVLNIILNLVLIPKYGIVGSAVATLVAQLSASVLFNAVLPKTRRIFFLQMKAIVGFGLLGNKLKAISSEEHAETAGN